MSDRKDRPEAAPRAFTDPKVGVDYDLLTGLLGFHLRFAQTAVVEHFMAALSGLDLTPTQFSVLTLVGANPGLSQSKLSAAVGIERSSAVRIIDVLERRGLIDRRKFDRRSNALHLTAAGADLAARAAPLVRAHDKAIAARLGVDEVEDLIALLDALGGA